MIDYLEEKIKKYIFVLITSTSQGPTVHDNPEPLAIGFDCYKTLDTTRTILHKEQIENCWIIQQQKKYKF